MKTVCLRAGTRPWTPKDVVLVSMDPAIKNLAVLVERRRGGVREILFWERWCLPDTGTYVALCAELEKIRPLLLECDVAVVERQNAITKGFHVHTNSKVMRVFGFLTGWLAGAFPAMTLYDQCPKAKGQVLGVPEGLTYAQTKAWSVATAKALLEGCPEQTKLTQRGVGKKDDLADVLVQAEAFLRLNAETVSEPVK